MSKQPHFISLDDDGHWYLIPEDKLAQFEELQNLFSEYEWDDPARDKIAVKLSKYNQYSIDNYQTIRILDWEDLSNHD